MPTSSLDGNDRLQRRADNWDNLTVPKPRGWRSLHGQDFGGNRGTCGNHGPIAAHRKADDRETADVGQLNQFLPHEFGIQRPVHQCRGKGTFVGIGAVGVIDIYPDFDPTTYRITPAPLTGYLDEGDVLDLGDCAFQVLHTPGHSPGSISLWDAKARTVFSGDALYDVDFLDNLYHSDPATLRRTLARLQGLGAQVFYAGHFPSFGQARMNELVEACARGENSLGDVIA